MKLKYQILLNVSLTLLLLYLIEKIQVILPYIPVISALILIYVFSKCWKQVKNSKLCFSVLKTILRLIQPCFKKNTYVLFDNLYEANAECIDTYCIFKYMQLNGIKSYYVVWMNNPFYEKIKQAGVKNIIPVKNSVHNQNDFEFFRKIWKILPKTKAVITSFGDLNGKTTKFLFKNKYITYCHVGHGSILLKTFVLSTPYFSAQKYNKFLVSSEQEANIFCRFGWKKENLPIIGLPRWDCLERKPQEQKTIFMMFTWRTSFGQWNKNKFKTPLDQTKYSVNIQSFLTDKKLQNLLKSHNIKLQVALHHALVNQTDGRYRLNCDNVDIVACENISRYIGQTDLFITDYSSIFFDFAFLNIPIVFYRPDFDDETLLELDREDMENAKSKDDLLYNICYDKDKAVQCIEHYIKTDFVLEEVNKRKNNALFSTKKNLTQKFIDYLEKL